jgi:hypothetical protein
MFDKGDTEGSFGPRHLVIHSWRVRGQIDLSALQGALDDVVVRHEMLRTSIVRDVDTAYQRVEPACSPDLTIQQVPASDAPRDERADAFVNEIEAGTMSVTELPHLRAVLGQFDDSDAVLVLITHHTASDGWSLHVMIHDLASFYAIRRGFEVPERPRLRQYREYAFHEQRELASPAADRSRAYWAGKLGGSEILDIRTDRRVPPDQPGIYSVHRFVVDQELSTAATEFAREMRCSAFMLLFSAFNALLHNMTGITDMVVPIITSGRNDDSFHETVGPFFNLVPLRTDVAGCRSFLELVRRIKTTSLESYENELPFGEIVAQAPEIMRTYERDDGAVCAFQTLQFSNALEAEQVGDLTYSEIRERTQSYPRTSDIPNGILWGLDILPDGRIAGTMRYNSLQFDPSTMQRMVDSFLRVLRNGVSDPGSPLSAL